MSGRFVRSSKYRHVFGRSTKKEQCYDNLRISRNAWDTNLVKANPHYVSVNWEASGGGAFAVIPINEKGRLPEQLPLFRGHTSVVLDTDWSPFDDRLIASGSDDGKAFIWKVPADFTLRTEEGEIPKDVAPVAKLTGHSRKIGHVLFNPAAESVLATSSGDYTIKIWDVEAGAAKLTLRHTDIFQSLSWSANGSLMVTTSRDKKLRIWDVRQEKPAHVVQGHAGAKNSRVTWMGEHDRVATTGFSKMSDRQLALWDIRSPQEPLGGFERLDSISGVCMPFWDDGTQCLYLAGKGDGNIRYFEYQNDKFEFLSEYKSSDPQRGIAFLPKRGVNTHENEVMRAFKTVNDSYIEPISFIVPRRAEVFQDDIFPPVVGIKPAVSAADWFNGKEGLPAKIDLASVYAGEEPAEIPSDYKPSSPLQPQSAATQTQSKPALEPAPQPAPQPALPTPVLRGPPPSMKDQTASIKDLAAKFDDDDASEDDEEDTSSFEEVPKPVDRSHMASSSAHSPGTKAEAPSPTASNKAAKPDDFIAQANQVAASQSTETQIASQREKLAAAGPATATTTASPPMKSTTSPLSPSSIPPTTATPTPTPTAATTQGGDGREGGSGNGEVQASLKEIKNLLEMQGRTMQSQNETIGRLTEEVEMLRKRVGE